MPRNITVTLADGSQHTYANAPDNITPGQVTARAMKEFGQSVKNLDGGGSPAPAPRTAPAGPPSAQNGFGLGQPTAPKGTPQRAAYDAEFNKRWLAANPAEAQRRAQEAHDQQLRTIGQNLSDNYGTSDFGKSVMGGLRAFPGANYLAAAGLKYLPAHARIPGTNIDLGTKNESNASFGDILKVVQARTAADQNKSTVGNIIGQVAGAYGGGGLISKGVQRLAGAAIPIASTAANYLTRLAPVATEGKVALGTRALNAAKVATLGAVGGGAAAVNQGEDAGTGAVTGAIAAPAVGVAAKTLNKLVLQPVSTALRLPGAAAILRKYVGTTAEDIQAATADWKAKAGNNAEPTIYEVLHSLKDREGVRAALARMPASARDNAAQLVRERGAAIGPEMKDKIGEVVAPARARIVSQIQNDLSLSKSTPGQPAAQLTPEEMALGENAADSAAGLKTARKTINNNIMAPHDDTLVAAEPSHLVPQMHGQPTDPEVGNLIGTVLGPRKLGQDINVSDVTRSVSKLKKMLPTAGVQTPIVQRTIAHLEDQLPADARAAWDRVTASNSKYMRMREGFIEGTNSRTRPLSDDTQALDNAYGTPDGGTGRALGQAGQLKVDINATPNASLQTAADIASNPQTQAGITANLGGRGRAGEQIADAAGAQTESARRLAGLGQESEGQSNGGLVGMAQSLMGMHPGSLPTSKIKALGALSSFFRGIPEEQANQMVDALFSKNPSHVVGALKLFNNAGARGQDALNKMFAALGSGTVGQIANQPAASVDPNAPSPVEAPAPPPVDPNAPLPAAAPPPVDPNAAPAAPPPVDPNAAPAAPAAPAPGDDPNVPYGHAVIASIFPNAEITSDVRDPSDPLSQKNPNSDHVKTQNAVDVRPIPGMSFGQFLNKINDNGHQIVHARDEALHPIPGLTTGPHWHVVVL